MPEIDDDDNFDGDDDQDTDNDVLALARHLLGETKTPARELSWDEQREYYEARALREQAERDAADAKRREVTYSASAPVADTPAAVLGAIGRTIGRCEDALEEVLYHGKFGPNFANRMSALKIMPAYAQSVAQLGSAVLRWSPRISAAPAARRDDPPAEDEGSR